MEINVGIKAPNFTLPSSSGRDVSLEDFMGTKVLIFFYPKDDTPGCTIEACGIRDEYENIKQLRESINKRISKNTNDGFNTTNKIEIALAPASLGP